MLCDYNVFAVQPLVDALRLGERWWKGGDCAILSS